MLQSFQQQRLGRARPNHEGVQPPQAGRPCVGRAAPSPSLIAGASISISTSSVPSPVRCTPLVAVSPLRPDVMCRAAAPTAEVASTSQPGEGASFTLTCEETGTNIHVFGVEHMAPQPHIGEWIIRHRPQAVVVETAMGPEHGALAGNVIRCGDQVVDPTAAFYLRMFCQIGITLQEFKEGDFTASPLWGNVRGSYNGEQLAYIGAFTTGTPLVFGDRPKDVTYRRLFGMTTIPQLDAGYSHAATQNYRAFLGLQPPPYNPDDLPVTEVITMQEREAVMLKVVHQLCHNKLPQQHLEGGMPNEIALVVGSAHLEGLRHLWTSGRWREVVGCAAADTPLPASQLLSTVPLPTPESDPQYGLRRGLMEAMLRLSVTAEVLADVGNVLGPIPERETIAYDAVKEVYGSPRMQLASLPRELLDQVVVGLGGDFKEALQPMHDVRPMNGGPGYSEDMVMYVRGLNFELD